MKKTYIEPAMTIVNVQIENVMTVTSNMGVNNTELNDASGDARGYSDWDD